MVEQTQVETPERFDLAHCELSLATSTTAVANSRSSIMEQWQSNP